MCLRLRIAVVTNLLFSTVCIRAQTGDSIYHQLQAVEIKPFSQEAQLRLLSSESIITAKDLGKQSSYSLLPALNTVPGVRMEERSPGSYRLSIRGSLLRSPFGVRNVKIYLGDLPFTDAGGNTYLNSLDIGNLNSLRILKGPQASVFGANTGGVLLIDPVYKSEDSLKVIASLSAGSFALLHQNFLVQQRGQNSLFTFSQGYQRSDGYRANSGLQRVYGQLSETWTYHPKSQLRVLALVSDLSYQTPGGLTWQQFEVDPKEARPATATLPGAQTQKAGVRDQLFFGGITNEIALNQRMRNVFSVFGTYNDFKNPFITNYEQRLEKTIGARTYLDGDIGKGKYVSAKWDVGGEWQQTNSAISNFGNRAGVKDTVQAADQLNAQQAFVFGRFLTDIGQRVLIETSLSYNYFTYYYKNEYPSHTSAFGHKKFNPQPMPRLAGSYKITENLSWRASVSRGYSPPTLDEVRSSNNVVNTALQSETAWSYETGIRIRDRRDYCWIDVCGFYYQLKNAIVERINSNGTDYFINAGGTNQPGLEVQAAIWLLKPTSRGVIRGLQLKGNLTHNQFTFSNYKADNTNYSGHPVTGVPAYTSTESLYLQFPFDLSLYGQYYYSSSISVNDANTARAKPYHLLQLKAEWKKTIKQMDLYFFAGADNLLNQVYSLGNDLNALGGRYYNAAPPRNYYAGVKTEF